MAILLSFCTTVLQALEISYPPQRNRAVIWWVINLDFKLESFVLLVGFIRRQDKFTCTFLESLS